MKTKIAALLLTSCAVCFGISPSFYCNFNDTVTPVIAAGKKTFKLEHAPEFRKGLKGKALLIGMDGKKIRHGVSYPHKQNLDWKQGTISFWVNPVNWNGTDTGFFAMFFSAWAGKNNFYIYKYHVGEFLYFMRGERGFWLFSLFRQGEWKAGEWHHVVCTWDPVQLSIYIDGQLATERRISFPLKNFEPKTDFVIGENKKTMKLKNKGRLSLIDEFKIFDRVLARQEIKSLYEQDKPAGIIPKGLVTVPYGKNTFTASGFIDRATDEYAVGQNSYTLSFDDQYLYVSLKKQVSNAQAELTSPNGKKHIFKLKNGKASIALQPLGLKPGAKGWLLNLTAGNTDLRDGLRLRLDRTMPTVSLTPPYDLTRNAVDLKVSKARGFNLIFDRDTTFHYGFRRLKANLNRSYSLQQDHMPDYLKINLVLEKDGTEYFRSSANIRKNQPLAVKFLYTKIRERQLFVAFHGKSSGYAVADFCDLKGKVQQSEKVQIPEDKTYYDLLFPIRLKSGDYLIKISHLGKNGKKTFIWDQELRVPPANDPLIAPYTDPQKDQLPPGGWIPVAADNNAVKIWGRTLKMDKGVIFSSLISQGKELLAAPDTLSLNGKKLVPRSVSVKKVHADILNAVFEKTVDYGTLKARIKLKVTFDGYARIVLKLIPVKPLKIKTLVYELPLKNERLKLVRDSQSVSKIAGLAHDQFSVSLLPIPAIWVGDYATGINFTAENLKNWHYRTMRHVEMKRDKEAAHLRFLLASAPFTFSKEREFVFGLTVTPVKPLNRKLLRQRDKKDWQLYDPWKHFNYLHPDNIKTEVPFRNLQNFYSQHRMFPVLFFYTAYNFTGPFSPFWTWYEEEWRQIKSNRNYGTWTGTKPNAYCEGCINGADYRNFRLNNLHDFLTRKNNPLMIPGTKNLYFDAPWEESCYNTKHGCTLWKDSTGALRTHILIDVFREKALNIWRMIKRTSPESLVTYHAEWGKFMPFQSFTDCMYGGEGQENEVAAKGGYYDILTPASFNATFSPYIWGTKTSLIPQLSRGLQLHYPVKYRSYDPPKARLEKGDPALHRSGGGPRYRLDGS
ncbi:MAG: LamG domain-containing protein [Lentisphaeria bacterium]|nr:LamG domain-containing protein [Lentisphaeria bacterium]